MSRSTEDQAVIKRIGRLKTYVEYFRLHGEATADRDPNTLERLVDYSRNHPELDMVVIYPEYIVWRNTD